MRQSWAYRWLSGAVGRRWCFVLLACIALSSCRQVQQPTTGSGSPASATQPADLPNILFVVWDTVRADHLSLYGHDRPTTPYLDGWARGARVYDNCVSVGSTTVPSHASFLTGLLPDEHGATNMSPHLSDDFEMLAELLAAKGYRTYMYTENPRLSEGNNFSQGFELVEHPWSARYRDLALQVVREQVPVYDRSTPIAEAIRSDAIRFNAIKSAGRVAQRAVLQWLKQTDRNRPFFIFLNYMACHYSLIPARLYRERFMTPAQVEASYQVDRTIPTYWAYTLGQHEYSKEDLDLTRATYDAALAELDGLFYNLLKRLDKKGYGENTIVVLTGDHGEHLGEHHMLDHQFSVYEPLMRVPLVLRAPGRIAAGRDQHPVTNMDIFPTLLEIVGVDPPVRSTAISLLHPAERRSRLGVYVGVMTAPLSDTRRQYPDFDPRPWNRTLRAYYDEPYKLVEGSDGRNELYRIDRDPGELHNLHSVEPQVAERLAGDLRAYLAALQPVTVRPPQKRAPMTEEDRERLRLLGYVDEE